MTNVWAKKEVGYVLTQVSETLHDHLFAHNLVIPEVVVVAVASFCVVLTGPVVQPRIVHEAEVVLAKPVSVAEEDVNPRPCHR